MIHRHNESIPIENSPDNNKIFFSTPNIIDFKIKSITKKETPEDYHPLIHSVKRTQKHEVLDRVREKQKNNSIWKELEWTNIHGQEVSGDIKLMHKILGDKPVTLKWIANIKKPIMLPDKEPEIDFFLLTEDNYYSDHYFNPTRSQTLRAEELGLSEKIPFDEEIYPKVAKLLKKKRRLPEDYEPRSEHELPKSISKGELELAELYLYVEKHIKDIIIRQVLNKKTLDTDKETLLLEFIAHVETLSKQQILQDEKAFLESFSSENLLDAKYLYTLPENVEIFMSLFESPGYKESNLEWQIMEQKKEKILELALGKRIYDLGSGNSFKLGQLLRDLPPQNVHPVDISYPMLFGAAKNLAGHDVQAHVADFNHLDVFFRKEDDKERKKDSPKDKFIMLLGGTIGNFSSEKQVEILNQIVSYMTEKDVLMIGTFLRKNAKESLEEHAKHYADKTSEKLARLPLDLLVKNMSKGFWDDKLEYTAIANHEKRDVELTFTLKKDISIDYTGQDGAKKHFSFQKGHKFVTAISHRYLHNDIDLLATNAGLMLYTNWLDNNSGDPQEERGTKYALTMFKKNPL